MSTLTDPLSNLLESLYTTGMKVTSPEPIEFDFPLASQRSEAELEAFSLNISDDDPTLTREVPPVASPLEVAMATTAPRPNRTLTSAAKSPRQRRNSAKVVSDYVKRVRKRSEQSPHTRHLRPSHDCLPRS